MKHASDNSGELIEIDFSRPGIPATAASLLPEIAKNGDQYTCSWNTDLGAEIKGTGETPEQAIQQWDRFLQDHLRQTNSNKELSAQLADLSAKQKNPSGDARKTNDETQDVKEGLPVKSEIHPENSVAEKDRKYTTDDANQNGSEQI
ncbi:MAG: hypothetical protein J7527_08005 [Chitinophagaceae bacterium]|nr:hypothetical protein [Chitinophagaceae bacterium]